MPGQAVIREAVIECVECGIKSVFKGRMALGQDLTCPECETWMEVVSLDPIEVDWIYDEPEHDDESEDG